MNMYEQWMMIGSVSLSAVLLVVVILSQVSLRRMRRQLRDHNQIVENAVNDIRALFSGAVGEGSRIYKLESRTRRITERQEQIENSKNSDRPYEQAIRMVQKGSSVDDLISICNLSKGEADLIMMVHGHKNENDKLGLFH